MIIYDLFIAIHYNPVSRGLAVATDGMALLSVKNKYVAFLISVFQILVLFAVGLMWLSELFIYMAVSFCIIGVRRVKAY